MINIADHREYIYDMIENYIQSCLTIEVEDGDWTMPNERKAILKFNGVEIASDTFDVVQQREYEG